MEPDLTGPLFRMRRIAKGGPDYVGRVRPCGVLLKKRGCLSFPLALFLWQPLAFSKGAANVDGPNPKKPNELRRRDLNPRPPGYEPGELPTAPRHDVELVDSHIAHPTCVNSCFKNRSSAAYRTGLAIRFTLTHILIQ